MKSRWEAGADAHQSRYFGWWVVVVAVGVMVVVGVGVTSFS